MLLSIQESLEKGIGNNSRYTKQGYYKQVCKGVKYSPESGLLYLTGYRIRKEVIEEGISRKVNEVWLEVRASNQAARGLYKKVGFKEVGLRPRYYPDTNEDAITMTLALQEMTETRKP